VGEREDIEPLLEIVLDAVAAEKGVPRAFLSLEIEQVVTQALFAARRAGTRATRRSRKSSTGYHASFTDTQPAMRVVKPEGDDEK
jgi:hypothetical protein